MNERDAATVAKAVREELQRAKDELRAEFKQAGAGTQQRIDMHALAQAMAQATKAILDRKLKPLHERIDEVEKQVRVARVKADALQFKRDLSEKADAA
jgi:hypothetical protein